MVGLSFFVSLWLASAFAVNGPKNLCEIIDLGEKTYYTIPLIPGYFFDVTRHDRTIVMTGQSTEGSPYVAFSLNYETGQMTQLKENVDPVYSQDGIIYTANRSIDEINPKTNKNDTRYELKLYIKDPKTSDFQEVSMGEDFVGTYQSIGSLGTHKGKTRYRILTSHNGGILYDIEIDLKTGVLKRIGTTQLTEFMNVKSSNDLKLPMLSRDGRQLSLLDLRSIPPTTKILELGDNRELKKINDLGFSTGKMRFSPDGKRAVFHNSLSFSTPGEHSDREFFSRPYYNNKLNIYEVNLKSRAIQQITFSSNNSYYPNYTNEGDIIYIEDDFFEKKEDFSIVVHKRKRRNSIEICNNQTSSTNAPVTLIDLFNKVCGSVLKTSAENAIRKIVSKEQCESLMRELSPTTDSKEDLSFICQGLKKDLDQDGYKKYNSSGSAQDLLIQHCGLCHTAGPHAIPFQQLMSGKPLDKKDYWIKKISTAIESGAMPVGAVLDPEEKKVMLNGLKNAQDVRF